MRPLLFATKPATSVLWATTILVLLGMSPAVGRADVILGNLEAGSRGNSVINSADYVAGSFTLGGQAYYHSDAQIILTNIPASDTTFQLESDSSGRSQPSDTVLSTFTNPTFGSGLTTYTFTAGSPFTLAANTTYWLVGSTNSSNTNWVTSNPATNPTGSGAAFGSYLFSFNSGTTWSNFSSVAPQFQLDGTPSVGSPEPSSLVLAGTVACVAAAVAWRRRRTRRPELAAVTALCADGP